MVNLRVESGVFPLRLTLGALAEIESSLGCSDLNELLETLKSLSVNQLATVLNALLRAGGLDDPQPISEQANPIQAAQAIARVFELSLKP